MSAVYVDYAPVCPMHRFVALFFAALRLTRPIREQIERLALSREKLPDRFRGPTVLLAHVVLM
jgi:hypothetical protein